MWVMWSAVAFGQPVDSWGSPLRDPCVEDGHCFWADTTDVLLYGGFGALATSAAAVALQPDPDGDDVRSVESAGSMLGGAAVAWLATFVVKESKVRDRPYTHSLVYKGCAPSESEPNQCPYDDHAYKDGKKSFPSGHTSMVSYNAFTTAFALNQLEPLTPTQRGLVFGAATVATVATGAGRVKAGKHYVGDVLAGAAVGVVSAGVFAWVLPNTIDGQSAFALQ